MKNFTFFFVFFLVAFLSVATMAQVPPAGLQLWLKADYGPTTWTQQSSGTTEILMDVSFTDSNNGTAVGTGGKILRTTNGGTTWTSQTSGTTNLLLHVSFTDSNNGTAVGTGGKILRTTNGGTTWTSQTSGTTNRLLGVSFTDANNGTVVGEIGTILRTTNGGTTWTSQTSGTTNYLLGVSFTDANNGTAVGYDGTILRTTNGGTTWTSQSSGTTNELHGVSFTDANTGTAVGWSGTILRTTNGGTTWTSQSSGTTNELWNVSFTDSNNGTVVGFDDRIDVDHPIYRTTNGGAVWTSQSSGTTNELWSVSFTDSNNGTVVGEHGTILRTTGSTVNRWIDQSGNENNAIQNNSERKPLLVNNELNSKPVVHFDGIDDRLALIGSTTMSQISLFLVFKIDSGLVGIEGTDPLPYYPIVLHGYGLSMRNFFSANSPNIIDPFIGEESWIQAEASNIAAFDQWKVLNVITNQTMWNTTVRSNGVDAVITPEGSSNLPLSVSLGRPDGSDGIGGADNVPAGHLIFKGDIAEVVVYDSVLSDSERLAVEQYLHNKYNITITDVTDNQNGSLPEEFILNQNYPNPFNPSTTIKYQIPELSFVILKVFDILGNEVATLVNEEKSIGKYEIEFDASRFSSGVYLYKLQAGNFIETKKMILLR